MILQYFTRFFKILKDFTWSCKLLHDISRFYKIFTWFFYMILQDFTRFKWFYKILLDFTWFYMIFQDLNDFKTFYKILHDFTRFTRFFTWFYKI
jgi:hypothetical protein